MKKRELLIVCLDSTSHIPISEFAAAQWNAQVVTNCTDTKAALSKGTFKLGLVLLNTPDENALECIEDVISSTKSVEWIALTSAECMQSPEVCRLIRGSFYDFHTLPVDPMRLLVTLGHAYGKAALNGRSEECCLKPCDSQMIGSSPVMLQLFQNIRKMQGSDSPVLITGESGTGKELAAKAIHAHSHRSRHPFVAVNCGALPAQLIQSELFGHEKGSFTGAMQRKLGRIESAAGGTVFLDEIGDIPLELQINLLRFLQEKTMERIGSNQSVSIDVRVIAATNVDLEKAVAEGRFREDLYYRLNVLRLRVPPLRERIPDIELLAQGFLGKCAANESRDLKRLSKKAVRAMSNYHWPGNVRELINRIRRAAVLSESSLITPADLGLDKFETKKVLLSLAEVREMAELEAIRNSLQHNMNNVTQASRQLKVSRVTLYRLMNKFQMHV